MSAEKITYQQIEDQHNSGHQASVLVKRSNGEISVGTYTGASEEKPGHYEVLVDGGDGARDVLPHTLADEYQAALAEQLAGTLVVRGIGSNAVKGLELGALNGPIDDGVKPEALRVLREQVAASGLADMPVHQAAEVDPQVDIKMKISEIITGIDSSIKNAGHIDPASMCGQRAEEIKRILYRGIDDQSTVAVLRQAIETLEQGSTASLSRNDSYATVAALSNARRILSAL